ncbi:hypothetical protein A4H97_28115 [Niastella yeongjuensis]|uniref:Uncharacterized protein n=1 Tax=Niastella yeongjuensis TaxID=354355 RepID=A0A1V9EUG0_9BACT|nr:hypothetical protein [Niastella yeongjuensis]OQP49759.1 hypothetical protein A4H97_28115 [Niastella yeongjuensis]
MDEPAARSACIQQNEFKWGGLRQITLSAKPEDKHQEQAMQLIVQRSKEFYHIVSCKTFSPLLTKTGA